MGVDFKMQSLCFAIACCFAGLCTGQPTLLNAIDEHPLPPPPPPPDPPSPMVSKGILVPFQSDVRNWQNEGVKKGLIFVGENWSFLLS